MKRLSLTFAIILGMTIGAMAQGGGLFGKGPDRQSESYEYSTREGGLMLPNSHGSTSDQSGDAPVGSSTLLLIGFGAAYALKRRK